jgi:hypothetical protein
LDINGLGCPGVSAHSLIDESESATGAVDELAFNERTHSVTSSSRYPLQFSKRKPGHTQIVEWEPMRETEPHCHWFIRSLIAKLINASRQFFACDIHVQFIRSNRTKLERGQDREENGRTPSIIRFLCYLATCQNEKPDANAATLTTLSVFQAAGRDDRMMST